MNQFFLALYIIVMQLSVGNMMKINKFDYCFLKEIEPIIVWKTDNRITGYSLTSLNSTVEVFRLEGVVLNVM